MCHAQWRRTRTPSPREHSLESYIREATEAHVRKRNAAVFAWVHNVQATAQTKVLLVFKSLIPPGRCCADEEMKFEEKLTSPVTKRRMYNVYG